MLTRAPRGVGARFVGRTGAGAARASTTRWRSSSGATRHPASRAACRVVKQGRVVLGEAWFEVADRRARARDGAHGPRTSSWPRCGSPGRSAGWSRPSAGVAFSRALRAMARELGSEPAGERLSPAGMTACRRGGRARPLRVGRAAAEYRRYHDEEWGRPVHGERGPVRAAHPRGVPVGPVVADDPAQAGGLPGGVRRVRPRARRRVRRPTTSPGCSPTPASSATGPRSRRRSRNARAALALRDRRGGLDALVWSFAPTARAAAPRDAGRRAGDRRRSRWRWPRRSSGTGFVFVGPTTAYARDAGLRPGRRPRRRAATSAVLADRSSVTGHGSAALEGRLLLGEERRHRGPVVLGGAGERHQLRPRGRATPRAGAPPSTPRPAGRRRRPPSARPASRRATSRDRGRRGRRPARPGRQARGPALPRRPRSAAAAAAPCAWRRRPGAAATRTSRSRPTARSREGEVEARGLGERSAGRRRRRRRRPRPRRRRSPPRRRAWASSARRSAIGL